MLLDRFVHAAIGLAINLENMGVPFLGEATPVAVAACAGAARHLSL